MSQYKGYDGGVFDGPAAMANNLRSVTPVVGELGRCDVEANFTACFPSGTVSFRSCLKDISASRRATIENAIMKYSYQHTSSLAVS